MVGTTDRTSSQSRTGLLPLVLLGAAIAAFVAAGLTLLSGSRPLESLGLPDPGRLTTYGLPVMRTVTEVAAVLAVGALLMVAFLAPPERVGYLDVVGYRTLRSASYAAGAWAVGALLMVPLTVADSLGQPVTGVLGFAQLVGLVPRLDTAQAWAVTALLATVLFAGCRVVLSWGGSVLLFALAVVGLLPVACTGHSSAGGAHDVATDSLMVHVVAAALWVGGLVALLSLASRRAEAQNRLPVAVCRFSALALVCWLVMAVSGVLNALVRIALPDLFGTYYGALLLAKTACLLVLGGLGYLQRRRAVRAVVEGSRGALLRIGAVEVLIMLGTVGLAVALGRSAPPVRGVVTPSRTAVEIGYDLDGPPTPFRLAFDWRFDLIFGTAAIVAAVCYLLWARRLAGRAQRWPVARAVSWLAGCVVVLLATSSGIGRYAPAMFSAQLVAHTLLTVVAPLLLVLGAPATLALGALPSSELGAPRGARELLLGAAGSGLARWLTSPPVAVVLFALPAYPLYLSGRFDALLMSHPEQLLADSYALASGLLFFWVLFGGESAPRHPRTATRLGLLVAAMAIQGLLGVLLDGTHRVLGRVFYGGLGLPWAPDLIADQRVGAVLALVLGELTLLAALLVLVVRRSRLAGITSACGELS
jgi:cytochrome c oxidase assembly factor CtaG/putative copper export protein